MSEGYLTNHFLVSMPQLEDENFARTVTLICQHDENGALGIVINRQSQHNLGEIFNQLGINVADLETMAKPVFEGGPVNPECGLVVHNAAREAKFRWESSMMISEQLGLTSSKDILEDIARGDGPDKYLMSLGYAGWGPGQLEQEMMQNSWLSAPVEHQILFDHQGDRKWHKVAASIGVDYDRLSTQAGHA